MRCIVRTPQTSGPQWSLLTSCYMQAAKKWRNIVLSTMLSRPAYQRRNSRLRKSWRNECSMTGPAFKTYLPRLPLPMWRLPGVGRQAKPMRYKSSKPMRIIRRCYSSGARPQGSHVAQIPQSFHRDQLAEIFDEAIATGKYPLLGEEKLNATEDEDVDGSAYITPHDRTED